MNEHLSKILSPEGVQLLHESHETEHQLVANIEAVRPPEGLPPWEIEQLLRRDFLYAVQHPEYDSNGYRLVIQDKYKWIEDAAAPGGIARCGIRGTCTRRRR